MSDIQRTRDWFTHSGQMQPAFTQQPDARQSAFYLGMQLEELAEKLAVLQKHSQLTDKTGPVADAAQAMSLLGTALKQGAYDAEVEAALKFDAEAMLDGDLDLLWVSIGAAAAQAADVLGAYDEVQRANWDKFPGGVVNRDLATGKVIKPEGWRGPDLQPFIHATLRKGA